MNKWEKMKDRLDSNLSKLTGPLDNGEKTTVALLAGLSTARLWTGELESSGDWNKLIARLTTARTTVAEMTDEGQGFAQFGLWDGLSAALSWADEFAKDEVPG